MDRVKKTKEQIIDTLLSDTRSGNLIWYIDRDIKYSRHTLIHDKDNRIDVIFKLSEDLMEDEYSLDSMYYMGEMFDTITLDIYLCKNNKKEIFCDRIYTNQFKLYDLMRIVTLKK